MNKFIKISLVILIGLIDLALVLVSIIFLWPLKTEHLQTGTPETISRSKAISQVESTLTDETKRSVIEECNTKLLVHEDSTKESMDNENSEDITAKPWNGNVVVFFHGITACPNQFNDLAQHFYNQGYNVYIPLAPYHGINLPKEHSNVTADELVDYVNKSITTATGLGKEVGVVGLSGGGLLGTWAAEYRPEVKRLLLLSPFYEPAATEAPKWQIPFLKVLYGKGVLSDIYSNPSNPENPGFSFKALAQYIIIKDNLKPKPDNLSLKNIGVIVSEDDSSIDKNLANSIPSKIAESNNLTLLKKTLPAEWRTGHAISSTDAPGLKKHQAELFKLYFDMYRGR